MPGHTFVEHTGGQEMVVAGPKHIPGVRAIGARPRERAGTTTRDDEGPESLGAFAGIRL